MPGAVCFFQSAVAVDPGHGRRSCRIVVPLAYTLDTQGVVRPGDGFRFRYFPPDPGGGVYCCLAPDCHVGENISKGSDDAQKQPADVLRSTVASLAAR